MVIDGKRVKRPELALVRFERERIRLPVHVVESAEHPRLIGQDPIKCWLLVVAPGRFRLVTQPAGAAAGGLSRILRQIEEAEATGVMLDRTESNVMDGIVARLVLCIMSEP